MKIDLEISGNDNAILSDMDRIVTETGQLMHMMVRPNGGRTFRLSRKFTGSKLTLELEEQISPLANVVPSPVIRQDVTKTHVLKTDPEHFKAILSGHKTCELRKNDRNFLTGQNIMLKETIWSQNDMLSGQPLAYTGRQILIQATHILYGRAYIIPEGWCLISFKRVMVWPNDAES